MFLWKLKSFFTFLTVKKSVEIISKYFSCNSGFFFQDLCKTCQSMQGRIVELLDKVGNEKITGAYSNLFCFLTDWLVKIVFIAFTWRDILSQWVNQSCCVTITLLLVNKCIFILLSFAIKY